LEQDLKNADKKEKDIHKLKVKLYKMKTEMKKIIPEIKKLGEYQNLNYEFEKAKSLDDYDNILSLIRKENEENIELTKTRLDTKNFD
jgi:hypothetical protein